MKRKIFFVLAALLGFGGAAMAQGKYVSEIKIQTYEKWWGLKLAEDFAQPLAGSFVIDTAEEDRRAVVTNAIYSNRGRYVYSSSPMKVEFDGERLVITSDVEKVQAVRGGNSLREAYLVCRHKYARTAEEQFAGDLFAMPLYELDDKLLHTQQKVEAFAEMVVGRKFPTGYVIIPDGWQSLGGELDFSHDTYPEPQAMIDRLHELGFKVMLTVGPYVPANGAPFLESRRDGLLILDEQGRPAVMERERGYYACLKMTPESAEQINLDLKIIRERYGVDGFYVDFREANELFDNMPSLKMEYVALWNKACEGLDNVVMSYGERMEEEFVYGFDMGRRADWNGMRESVEMALKSSMFGFSHFAYVPLLATDDAATVRAVQLSMSMPVAVVPGEAWSLKNGNVLKSMLEWRASIAEYMAETVRSANVTDEPLIRSMEYQFGGTGFYNCIDQFMLGPKYLIAPVMEESSMRMVRLPRGTWKAPNGERYRGPRIVNVDVSNGAAAIFELQ